MTIHYLYWINLEEHSNHLTEGYVGVTNDLERRISVHNRQARDGTHTNAYLSRVLNKYGTDVRMTVLFKGTADECFNLEKLYRPEHKIGWNIAPGGLGGAITTGMSMSDEFKARRSELMKGNTLATAGKGKSKSPEHKAKIAAALKGRSISEDRKAKQSATMSGRVLTDDHKRKIAESARGRKRGPYKKRVVLEPLDS